MSEEDCDSVSDGAIQPILDSIALGRTDITKTILDQVKTNLQKSGDNPNEKDSLYLRFVNSGHQEKDNFLHMAAKEGKQDIVLTLLQCGADPSIPDNDGKKLSETCKDFERILLPSMLTAIASSNVSLVQQILDSGLNPNTKDEKSQSLLHWASAHANAEMVQVLLISGAEPNATDIDGVAPLHEALKRNSEEIAELLAENGADLHLRANTGKFAGETPLDLIRMSDYHWSSDFLSKLPLTNGDTPEPKMNGNSNVVKWNGDEGGQDEITELPDLTRDHSNMIAPSITTESSKELSLNNGPISPLAPVITDERLNHLWPQPGFIKQLSGEPFIFPTDLPLSISSGKESIHDILDVFDIHRSRLRALNRKIFLSESDPVRNHFGSKSNESTIHFSSKKNTNHVVGSYTLHILEQKIKITSSDLCGLHHALNTLIQMFTLFKEEGLVSCVIVDQPQCSVRGVLLDMNPYGRVPKIEIMMQTIEILSYLKVNQLQAFVRISRDSHWSYSYDKSELLSIDRFCKQRFIRFVPALDVDSSFSANDLHLLLPKIRDILSCYEQRDFIHIGPVLTSFVFNSTECSRYFDLLFGDIDTVMVCGNSIANLELPECPSNVVALQYGFKKNHNFTSGMSQIQNLGMDIGLCSGTVAWSNLAGSPDEMISSVVSGHHALDKLHGKISLSAQWSSDPALCHSIFSWPGFLVSSGLAWNTSTPQNYIEFILEDLLDIHVIGSPHSLSWGKVILELGKTEHSLDQNLTLPLNSLAKNKMSLSVPRVKAQSLLLQFLTEPDEVNIEEISPESLAILIQQVRRSQSLLFNSSPSPLRRHHKHKDPMNNEHQRLEAVRHELQITIDLMMMAAKIGRALVMSGAHPVRSKTPPLQVEADIVNIGLANLTPTFRTDTANKLLSLLEQFRALWLSRYLSPGLQGSLSTLNHLLRKFVPEGILL